MVLETNNLTKKISTGSYDFNKWLYGCYEKGIITMIVGPPGSGKTNFTTLAASSQAKKGKKVIFIDTEGGFSLDRVNQIVDKNKEMLDKILNNIFLLKPTNFEEQKKSFSELLKRVKKEHLGLIIVDGMSMLYRLELGDAIRSKEQEKIQQINREMAKQMRALAEISRKQQIPIIITNQVYAGFVSEEDWKKGVKGKTNIVGGDLFKYWSKCIIELENNNNRKKAILLKHRSLPQKQMSFVIKDRGLFRKGWM
jgi:DNA repair protein RadB